MPLFKLSNYSMLFRAGCAVVLRPRDFRRDSSPASPVKDDSFESSLAQVNDDEKKADDRLDVLAVHLLRHGASWSLSKMETLLQGWRVDDDTRMGSIRESFKEAALAKSVHKSRTAFSLLAPTVSDRYLVKLFEGLTLTAESEHGLCSKREVIISKFDALLVKRGGVELAIKIENGQATCSQARRGRVLEMAHSIQGRRRTTAAIHKAEKKRHQGEREAGCRRERQNDGLGTKADDVRQDKGQSRVRGHCWR